MSSEQPASKTSGQTIIFIVVLAMLFLFFIWSSLSTGRSKGYEDIQDSPPPKAVEKP